MPRERGDHKVIAMGRMVELPSIKPCSMNRNDDVVIARVIVSGPEKTRAKT